MTTYERGREPAGAPVTWEHHEEFEGVYVVTLGHDAADHPATVEVRDDNYADAICRAFHAAAEWRKLAGELVSEIDALSPANGVDGISEALRLRWCAMKETFGD